MGDCRGVHGSLSGVPVVSVSVETEKYDFDQAKRWLTHLETRLDSNARSVLLDVGFDAARAAFELSSTVPNIVAKPFNPNASSRVSNAAINDIVDAVLGAKFVKNRRKFEEWTLSRGTP